MNIDIPKNDNKSCKCSFQVEGKTVTFSGDFDSGNLEKVEQYYGSTKQYKIWPGFDSQNQECSSKTFFHFLVSGFTSTKVRFRVTNLAIISSVLKRQSQKIHLYRPVYKTDCMEEYERIPTPVFSHNSFQKVQMVFQYKFTNQQHVYFAFSFPYSYEKSRNLTQSLLKQLENDSQIYFHREVLITSQQQRDVQLITVTNKQNCLKQRDNLVDGLFPYAYDKRPYKIKPLPKILITTRVHPGESPSSYCFQGLIKFLTNKNDYRAHLLRKKFHFILIPMLNPDGVYRGMFRWDPVTKQDLNRVYTKCTKKSQPTIWAVKQYIEKVLKGVQFYFDLHSHASLKHFFLYGNEFDNIVNQTQTELFAKILSLNCPYFNVEDCYFNKQSGQKKGEDTKQGCARYFLMKTYKIVHSFTIQCGYHAPQLFHPLPTPSNSNIIYEGMFQMIEQDNPKPSFYTIQSYMDLGKSVLVSILDSLDINPFSRIPNSDEKSLEQMRKLICTQLYKKDDRLRMSDPLASRRVKNINQFCCQYYKNMLAKFKQMAKSLPKIKPNQRRNPYTNQSVTQVQFAEIKKKQIQISPKVKSYSVQSIKQLQFGKKSKTPVLTQMTTVRESLNQSYVKMSRRLPNKTVETERLIYRMKKIEQNRQKQRDSLSHKLLPIKQSEHLLEIIKQRLDASSSLHHRGYVPSSSLPSVKGNQKLKRDSFKFTKRVRNYIL